MTTSSGTEYLTSNTQVAYPFAEDALGLVHDTVGVHGAVAYLPVNVVIDAVAYVPDYVETLYLSSIAHVSGSISRLVFKNQAGAVIVTSDFDDSTLDWSKTYTVIPLLDVGGIWSVRLVVLTQALDAYLVGCTADDFGTRLAFESRVLSYQLNKVESIQLFSDLVTPVSPEITGRIAFVDGYNCEYTSVASTTPDTTDVTMIMAPGSGLGLYPCTEVAPVVNKRLMGLVPDKAGNINFQGDACYNVIPGEVLQINSSCVACCSCEDYANVTKALKLLLSKSSSILHKFTAGRDNYERGVAHYNTVVAAKFIRPQLFASGFAGYKDVAGAVVAPGLSGRQLSNAGAWATVSAELKNNTQFNMKITSFGLSLNPTNTIESVHYTYDGAGAVGNDTALLMNKVIAKGRTLSVGIRVKASNWDPSTAAAWTGAVTASVLVTPAGTPPPPVPSPYSVSLTASLVF